MVLRVFYALNPLGVVGGLPPTARSTTVVACSWLAALLLMAVGASLQAAAIDSTDKYAWSETSGWLNHKSSHAQATVYADRLEGYVWGSQIGWIKLNGSNWGVIHDGNGNLSGYAWSETVGWINFNPTHSQVTIDLSTGDFDGYAWGSKIGWISFKGSNYKVMLFIDSDGDGIEDKTDNCPSIANDDQADNDGDNLGNVCDPSPNDAQGDADGDGLLDTLEVRLGLNPNNSDTDGDSMPDGYEYVHELNPLVDDTLEDRDEDGYSNLEEYEAGSNPNSPYDVPRRTKAWRAIIPLILNQ